MKRIESRKRLFNLSEASEYLALSTSALRRLIREGSLVTVRVSPRGRCLIDVADLDRWIRANRRPITPRKSRTR